MRYATVCSGIEAPSVAWYPLGWQPVFFSEIEPFPCAVLAHHYSDVPNHGNMTKFKEWPDATLDVLCGGTPCQSFSVAGLRKGLDDPRGNLTLVYLAIAAKYRPRWLVWENVPGVLSDKTGAFGAFLGGLGQLGYGFAYRVFDAQYFGVPQRRRRVFVVGCLGDWRAAAAVLFERHSLQGHPAPSREAGEGTADATARSVAIRGRDGTPQAELGDDKANTILTPNGGRGGIGCGAVLAPETVPSLTASGRGVERTGESRGQDPVVVVAPEIARCIATREGTSQDWETTTMVAHSLRADGFDASEDGTGRGTPLVTALYPTNRQPEFGHYENVSPAVKVGSSGSSGNRENPSSGPDGIGVRGDGVSYTLEARQEVQAVAFAQNQRDELRTMDVAGALAAEPGMKQQTYIASMQVRRLTPTECSRLQGFPDDYLTQVTWRGKCPPPDGPMYKALGNSMATPVVRWIGERIAMVAEVTA